MAINDEEIQRKKELEAAEAEKAEEESKTATEVETTEPEKKDEEQGGETQTPKEEEVETEVEEKVEEKQPESPMFTQEQVNELVGRARQEGRKSAAQELFKRYGVESDDELNDLFGKGQSYEVLNDDYQTQSGEFRRISAENALLKSKVPENRWEDVMLILTGKGLDITPDNIMAMSETHPEWLGNNVVTNNIVPPQERVAPTATVQNNNVVPASAPEMQQQSVEFNNRMLRPKTQDEVVPPDAGKVRAIGSTTKNPKENEDESKNILKWMGAL